ncbi:NusA N-terminal domain-containing protein [Nannocystis pusilla]|uniref:NusA N-terminal domain-containing protein n=1 Tax=Nannocystis pusilla TaxID=889268 RepID=UPI003DA2CBF8
MDLSAEIDRIARDQGREPAELTRELESAVVDAAHEAWGRERELEGHFNADSNTVEIFQIVRVVEAVDPSRTTREMDLATAAELGGEAGDELLLQVLYRDVDGDSAVHTAQLPWAQLLPPLERPRRGARLRRTTRVDAPAVAAPAHALAVRAPCHAPCDARGAGHHRPLPR